MDKQIITFSANEQTLRKTGGLDIYASKTVSYIEAHFELGQNWSGYDSIEAVWWNDYVRPVRTVLDTEGVCVVPTEVLLRKSVVYVNLVGVIASGNTLTDRLTSVPITALTVKFNAQLGEGTTTPLTPSEYEQFVATVKADADRAEDAKDSARGYAGNALSSAQNALVSETNASTSETNAHTSEVNAKASEDNAKISELSASASAESASEDAGRAESAKDAVLGMRAEATTLEPNESATASYSDGVLTLGIPKGDKGQQGIQGETGATPNLTIGTVETLEPTEDATATITGTAENPVLNLGIPQGEVGEVSYADLKTLLPMDTASGSIVSITDGQSVIPVDSLKVSLEPIQSGSGTPSPTNIRPISGHTEVDTHRTGVNVWDEEWEVGQYSTSNGTKTTGNNLRSKNMIPVLPGVKYFVASVTATSAMAFPMFFYDADGEFIEFIMGGINSAFIIPANAHYMNFYCGAAYGTTYKSDISINYPSTDHDYHAYNGNTYTTTLGRTVYGGTLDVVSGELVVTHEAVDMGSLAWASYGTGLFYANLTGAKVSEYSTPSNAYCSCYEILSMAQTATKTGVAINNGQSRANAHDETYSSASDFKSGVSGQTLVYELATPTTVQLTPTEVKLLLGNNAIWSDGDVAIIYSADVTKWIEKQLS